MEGEQLRPRSLLALLAVCLFVYCPDGGELSPIKVSVRLLSRVCVCVFVCLNKLYCLSLDDGDGVVRRGELRRALTRPKSRSPSARLPPDRSTSIVLKPSRNGGGNRRVE